MSCGGKHKASYSPGLIDSSGTNTSVNGCTSPSFPVRLGDVDVAGMSGCAATVLVPAPPIVGPGAAAVVVAALIWFNGTLSGGTGKLNLMKKYGGFNILLVWPVSANGTNQRNVFFPLFRLILLQLQTCSRLLTWLVKLVPEGGFAEGGIDPVCRGHRAQISAPATPGVARGRRRAARAMV